MTSRKHTYIGNAVGVPGYGEAPDVTAPVPTLIAGAQSITGTVDYLLTFPENVIGLLSTDLVVINGAVSSWVAVDGKTYTFTITPTLSGTTTVTVPAGVCEDLAGNLNTFGSDSYYALPWLLLDRYGTDLTAGNVNGTLSDSGHTRTVTDSAPNAVVTGGEFKITAVADGRDPWLRYTTGWARKSGRMLRVDGSASGTGSNDPMYGFATTLTTPGLSENIGMRTSPTGLILSTLPSLQIGPGAAPGSINSFNIILRSLGHFDVVGGKLYHIVRVNNAAVLYPHVAPLNVDVSVDLRLDNIGVIDLDPTDPTLFPTPTLSDTFALPVAADSSGNGLDGVYNKVGLDNADGARFVGVSHVDIYTATLAQLFNGRRGSWVAQVTSISPTSGQMLHLWKDNSNDLAFYLTGLNTFRYVYIAAATSTSVNGTGYTAPLTPTVFGASWSYTGDFFKGYKSGTQVGATQTGLGAYAGTVSSGRTVIGAYDIAGQSGWNGGIAPFILTMDSTAGANDAYILSDAEHATIAGHLTANTLTKAILDGIITTGKYVWYKLNEQYQSDGLAHVEGGAGDGVTWDANANNWYAAANKLYIVPQPGAELLVNGTFAAWTGDNPDGWTIANEDANNYITENPAGHAQVVSNNTAAILLWQAPTIAGLFVRLTGIVSAATAGGLTAYAGQGGTLPSFFHAVGTQTGTKRAKTNILQINREGACDVTLDSVSLVAYAFADCLRVASPADSDEPYQSIDMTIDPNTQAGGVINLDSMNNPQNCIHWWIDHIDSKAYVREMVAGVFQADAVAGVAVTYSAGGRGEIRRIGNSVYLFYNGVYVASFTTVVSSANTKQALFLTSAGSYLQNVTSYPTGSLDLSAYQ